LFLAAGAKKQRRGDLRSAKPPGLAAIASRLRSLTLSLAAITTNQLPDKSQAPTHFLSFILRQQHSYFAPYHFSSFIIGMRDQTQTYMHSFSSLISIP